MVSDKYNNRLKVLAVEDEHVLKMVYKKILEKEGVDYRIAENGKEGLDTYIQEWEKGEGFNLVISDISMPTMDGNEMAKNIRKYESDNQIPRADLYALTAYDNVEMKNKCLESGYDKVIGKESIFNDIKGIINKYIK